MSKPLKLMHPTKLSAQTEKAEEKFSSERKTSSFSEFPPGWIKISFSVLSYPLDNLFSTQLFEL